MGPTAGGFQWRISGYTKKGRLDSTFGADGTVTTSMSGAGDEDEHLWELALQPDGKVVAAGEAVTATGGLDVALARFNRDGTLDSGFGTGGKVTTAIGPGALRDNAFQVAIDRHGKIVVSGFADMGPGAGRRNFMLARYTENGTLDSSFGSGGIVVTAVAPGDNRDQGATNGMAIDADDRIVVAGQSNMGPGAGGLNFALARYDADGSLDSSFDGDGIVTTAIAPGDNIDGVVGVAISGDDDIVAGGFADVGGFDLALARYNPDGSLDSSFGTGGRTITNVGPGSTDDDLEAIVVQRRGKILIGGATAATALEIDGDFLVARYNPDGTLDASFGNGGIVKSPVAAGNGDDAIFDLALQRNAKLIASGECEQATTGRDVCVARYKAGGEDEGDD